ncbi:unnamed protein product [Rotaria socialis]|uniref:Receptor expression-enhancing protein n=1 Tax=Rotaria socialis TaxID=392032 RepID=A0A817VCM4_9BILA|nr:unnamed protein product [Rotaria socialis]
MVSSLLARSIIVTIGTLYPGYRSYKSLITSDLREVVHWLRYWILFSIFIACETVTDVFLSWFPFYYWIKIALVLWMSSPAGTTLLYKRFVQPVLKEREQEIDELLEQTKQKGYSTLLDLTNKGVRYASNIFLNTAVLGQAYLGEHLKRSLSASDINSGQAKNFFNPSDPLLEEDEDEQEVQPKVNKRSKESQNHLSKGTNGANRRLRSNQQAKSNNSFDDQIGEFEMPTSRTRKQQKSTVNKTSPTIYSSNESSHLGTISKRQMIKTTVTTTRAPIVKSKAIIEQETNEIDDENVQSTL